MPKHDVPLDWVHAPRQERSQKTLEKLLDAAEELIREGGLDAVTVPAVVARAESSVGSFYARFPDKGALLETLHERACNQTIWTFERALEPSLWEGRSLESIIAAMVAFSVRTFGSRRSIMTAFHRALGHEPVYAERRARNGVELAKLVTTLFEQHRARIGHPSFDDAIPMALRVLTATLEQRNGFVASGVAEVDVPDEVLERELVRMILAYLDVRPEP